MVSGDLCPCVFTVQVVCRLLACNQASAFLNAMNDGETSIPQILCSTLRPCLHKGKTQIFPCGLASRLHENPVFITENDYF